MVEQSPAKSDWVDDLLRQRIRALFRKLPGAIAGEEEAVHDMRVAGRRMRVVLPLVARKAHGRRVRRCLRITRSLVRAAGKGRDLDVLAGLLEKHMPREGALPDETAVLKRRLDAARSRSRRKLADGLLDVPVHRLRGDLRIVMRRGSETPRRVVERLRQTMRSETLLFLEGLTGSERQFDPIGLHELRRRARRMRYMMEVAALVWDDARQVPDRLRLLQDELGHVHDAHVLAEWMGRQATVAQRGSLGPLAEEARRLQEMFQTLARDHHVLFLGLEPGTIVWLAEAVVEKGSRELCGY